MISQLIAFKNEKEVVVKTQYGKTRNVYNIDLTDLPNSLDKLNDSMSDIDAEMVLMFLATTCRNLNLHGDAIAILMLRKLYIGAWVNDGLHDD